MTGIPNRPNRTRSKGFPHDRFLVLVNFGLQPLDGEVQISPATHLLFLAGRRAYPGDLGLQPRICL
jgi:hypothetical protein